MTARTPACEAESDILQEKPHNDDSESEAPHKDPSLIQRVEEEVRHEIDEASRRKVASAEARIVAYSDSDSEEELPFKRSSRHTAAGGTDTSDSRHGHSLGSCVTAAAGPVRWPLHSLACSWCM